MNISLCIERLFFQSDRYRIVHTPQQLWCGDTGKIYSDIIGVASLKCFTDIMVIFYPTFVTLNLFEEKLSLISLLYLLSHVHKSWWRHQMGPFSALLALCVGNSPVPVNFPHHGQWRGALMFSLICVWINDWVNNCEAGDLRRHRAHYDVNVMTITFTNCILYVSDIAKVWYTLTRLWPFDSDGISS